jgi:MFS family permease
MKAQRWQIRSGVGCGTWSGLEPNEWIMGPRARAANAPGRARGGRVGSPLVTEPAPVDSATPVYGSLTSVLSDGPVRSLVASQFLYSVGFSLQAAVLGLQIFEITDREFDLGLLGLAEFAPAALLVLVSGSVADRFNRRKVAVIGLLAEFICGIALMVYALSDPTRAWPIFVIAICFGAARSFVSPATRAMPPMVAPEGALPRVIAVNSATWTAAYIVGPAMSGFLYAIDPWVAYATSAALVGVGTGLMAFVRFRRQPPPPDPGSRPSVHSALEGLKFIRRTPILFAAISLDLFAVLFGGAVALLPAIAKNRLGVGEVAYGWLRAAGGIGAAGMAFALAVKPVSRFVGKRLLICVGLFGVATIALGATHNYWVAFVAVVVLSSADMVSVFIRSTLVPLVTPDDKRGRVLAVENVFIGASNELGAFESGVAAALMGTPVAIIGGGIATLVVVGTWWWKFPALRDVDRFEDILVD